MSSVASHMLSEKGLTLNETLSCALIATLVVWFSDHLTRLAMEPLIHIGACRVVGLDPPPFSIQGIIRAGMELPKNWYEVLGIASLISGGQFLSGRASQHRWLVPTLIAAGTTLVTMLRQGQFFILGKEPGTAFYLMGVLGTATSICFACFGAWFACNAYINLSRRIHREAMRV